MLTVSKYTLVPFDTVNLRLRNVLGETLCSADMTTELHSFYRSNPSKIDDSEEICHLRGAADARIRGAALLG